MWFGGALVFSPKVLPGVGLDFTGVNGRDDTREVGVDDLGPAVKVEREFGVDGREIDVTEAELVLRIEEDLLELE